jgi:aryl-alcohol dehydrogenase-like predicted oxidoreductase
MQRRTLGRTGLEVSALSFGCGAVGGLMVRGEPADQERAVARAIDLGINYFDTAALYGNGESERNLGRVLKNLGRPAVLVGTKVWVRDRENIAKIIAQSLEESLRRLGMDSVDLFQLHDPIAPAGTPDTLDPRVVRDEVVPVFEKLRAQGKFRYAGFTGLGQTVALLEVVDSALFDTVQVSYNMLNPTASAGMPERYPAQDYGRLLVHAGKARMGTIAIRILAGGALSATEERHPLGMQKVDPLGSASTYAADVARARRFEDLVQRGYAQTMVEAALRYAISTPTLSTVLVGLSTLGQLEYAAASVCKGPLSPAALECVAAIQQGFSGEPR